MLRRLSLVAVAILPLPLYAAHPAGLERGASRISATSAYITVEILASPEMMGRLSGTEGYRKAASWIAAEARRAGLRPPIGLPEYFQPFTHPGRTLESASLTLMPDESAPDAKPEEMEMFKDFAPMVNAGSGDVTAEVVFAGFGFHAPDLGRDDYAGLDVKDKIVMVLPGKPEKGEWKDHNTPKARTYTAARMGAAGFLRVGVGQPTLTVGVRVSPERPAARVSEAFADKILANQKLTSADLRKVLSKGGTASFPTGRRVHFVVKGPPRQEMTTHNVLALIPGAIPGLRGEYVLVGAHLDHLGEWPRLNPGADDNASGSAALLEVARAMGALKARPRRTVAFVWFAAEEEGLLGAEHFAKNPPQGLQKCIAVLNIDMVGVGTVVSVVGGENFPLIYSALQESRDRFAPGFTLEAARIRGLAQSDHGPFFDKGIPAVSLFGPDKEWRHSPEDTLYALTPKTIEAAARIVFGAAWTLADAP